MTRAAEILRPGGALATVTIMHVAGGSERFFADAQRCYERWDPSTQPGVKLADPATVPPTVDEVDSSPLFALRARRRYEQTISYSTAEYLNLLMTYSGQRALQTEQRNGLLGCLRELIDTDHDGKIAKRYLYELRVATRTK